MAELIAELLPSMLGLAITPTAIALGILFLSSKQPVANATFFALPFAIIYTLFALIMLALAGSDEGPLLSDTTKHWIGLFVGLLLIAIGVAQYLRGRAAPVQRTGLIDKVADAKPYMAFGLGFVVAFVNPNVAILFAGLATAAAAEVSNTERAIGAGLLVASSEVGLVGPILWYLLIPERAGRGLTKLRRWLSAHEKALDIAVALVFGVIFTLKSLQGLLS